MPESFTIVLDLPPRELSPNARVHWSRLYRAKKSYGDAAYAMILERGVPASCPWTKARARAAFYFAKEPPGGKRRDADNYAAMLKCVHDQFQAAGVIVNDAGLQHEPVSLTVNPECPECVIVCVERIE